MPGTRKLGKTTDQRKAMLRQQVTDLLDMGRMETTVFRAKEIAPLAEKMITLGKKKDMAAYRQALAFITREDVAKKVFEEVAPKYADRNGGYTRITRIGTRRGDAAEMAVIELVQGLPEHKFKCTDRSAAGAFSACQKPRRVSPPQRRKKVRSFSPATCASGKILLGLQTHALSAKGGQCVRYSQAANPFVKKAVLF